MAVTQDPLTGTLQVRILPNAPYNYLMQLKQKNSKKQGDVGLGIAIGYFSSHGITVCIPLTDSQDYDLVIDKDDALKKVQVKTTTMKSRNGAGYYAELRTCGGNKSWSGIVKKFDPNKVDYLFVLTESGDQYLIPSYLVKGQSGITVGGQLYKEFLVGTWARIGKPGELF